MPTHGGTEQKGNAARSMCLAPPHAPWKRNRLHFQKWGCRVKFAPAPGWSWRHWLVSGKGLNFSQGTCDFVPWPPSVPQQGPTRGTAGLLEPSGAAQ